MSSEKASALNGQNHVNHIHEPRARKPVNPQLHRALNNELNLHPDHRASAATASRVSSERATPAPPDDAPPSVKATSAARKHIRQRTKQRIFPTVEYHDRVSYFDPRSSYGNFRGFFVLFWIGLAIMVITSMLRNLRETGNLLNSRQWPLFTKDLDELAISDLLMCASTALDLPLHLIYRNSKGFLRWNKGGMILQSLYQAAWLWLWISWPFLRDWTWTAQVFFTLHTLCLFMKMHSYAFYNGHLSISLARLKELDRPIGPMTPTAAAVRYPPAQSRLATTNQDDEEDEGNEENVPPVAQLRSDLAEELTSPMGNVTYPQNLTLANFADYLLCPTLCYELEYPRNPTRSYLELFYKTLAVFGCIFLMTVTSEEFIIPVLDESQHRLVKSRTWIDSALIFAETVSRLLFPFMITFLLVFLSIFEYTLGAFAEITRFADRQFYVDWWNSLDWMEFSREWNIPVHNFFRRHVYSASRSAKMSRTAATALTFLISALAHELIMGCITRKFRGYGFILMMFQMPFVVVQRMPWVRDQQLLNNIIFWICMIFGLSLLCALYVLV
ncbi:related to sterol O-acyltransferase Diacylglycerol O-acyltransferase [Lecanosticta acicola]|uniref:O-acyltransferase n=1 Tax=Lecanosticta acicola TaxID=111012 RepID=A0AAI8YUF2_9PEZI|nr:related to sterol O-acyltransferase Diacylglycerol O-acyltransferase [Lecanosticta acicola]